MTRKKDSTKKFGFWYC